VHRIGLDVDTAILELDGDYDQIVDMIEVSPDMPFGDIWVRIVDD
jgi:hypothetical protein